MGIEKLYNQFNLTFNIVDEIKDTKLKNIDYIIFDFNAIIHNTITDVEFIKKSFNNDIEQNIYYDNLMIQKTIENIFLHIKNIVNIKNDKFIEILIYMDGIPTLNKINEQRHRKYIGKIEQLLLEQNVEWDRNKISPGTQFMKNLAIQMSTNEFKEQLKNINCNLHLLSDTLEFDEAEIKIMRKLKDNDFYNENKKYVVISPDGDFILLLLWINKKNIWIINIQKPEQYLYNNIDIYKLGKLITKHVKYYIWFFNSLLDNKSQFDFEWKYVNNAIINILKNYKSIVMNFLNNEKQNNNKIINWNILKDLILIFIFFGNDFVPKIFTMEVNEINIHLIIIFYWLGFFIYNKKNQNTY